MNKNRWVVYIQGRGRGWEGGGVRCVVLYINYYYYIIYIYLTNSTTYARVSRQITSIFHPPPPRRPISRHETTSHATRMMRWAPRPVEVDRRLPSGILHPIFMPALIQHISHSRKHRRAGAQERAQRPRHPCGYPHTRRHQNGVSGLPSPATAIFTRPCGGEAIFRAGPHLAGAAL